MTSILRRIGEGIGLLLAWLIGAAALLALLSFWSIFGWVGERFDWFFDWLFA